MKYSVVKQRLKLLKCSGFEREMWSKSYHKTLTKGIHNYRQYISYYDIKQTGDFRHFLHRTIEIMNMEFDRYISNQ